MVLSICIAGGGFIAGSGEVDAAAPTGVSLNPAVVMENSPPGTVVGTLVAVDSDVGDSHTFSLEYPETEGVYEIFVVSGNQLIVKETITQDFDAVGGAPGYVIQVKATDASKASFKQYILIGVTDDRSEDADRDGLTELVEEGTHGTSDVKFDSDGDGVGDGMELAVGTSPTDPNAWPQTSLIGWGKSDEREQMMPPGEEFVVLATGQNHSLAMSAGGVIQAWGGSGLYDQITPPAGLTDVVALAAGGDYWPDDSAHSLALKGDGTVVAWGYDGGGMIAPPVGLAQVIEIDAGRSLGIALKTDGTVVTWGSNPFGEIAPPAGLSDVVAVAAGGYRCLALKGDGTVVAWGSQFNGLAWEDAVVPTGLAGVVALSAGRFHNLALKSDGTVVAWGDNSEGQTNVPAGLLNVVAVAAGGFHSLALKADGSVVAWGSNRYGQATVPVAGLNGVKLISAGLHHSLAVHFGGNYPEITSSPQILAIPGVPVVHPVVVANPGTSALVFSAFGLPTGLTIDPVTGVISGTVASATRRSIRIQVKAGTRRLSQAAWLGVSTGQAPTAVAVTPAVVVENSPAGTVIGSLSAVDPDAGDAHTFEWVDGEGAGDNGMFRIEGDQLVLNEALTRNFEQNTAGFSIRVRARDAALNPFEQVIALQFQDDRMEDADGDGLTEQAEEDVHFTSDTLYDWDADGFGDGFEVARNTGPKVAGSLPSGRILMAWGNAEDGRTALTNGLGDAIGLAAGGLHSLALKSNGVVVAWGGNAHGQSTVPQDLGPAIAVEAGALHSLALESDGMVRAWGNNDAGQTGVPEGLSGVVEISAGGYHNLALRNDGTVSAWGFNDYGQATVPPDLTNVVAVAAGGYHSLALRSDGTVVAWGWEDYTVVPEGLNGVVAIAAGGFHSLALRYDGTVVAWGADVEGQSTVPAELTGVVQISAGWRHSLVLKADGTMVAWGANADGQVTVPVEGTAIRKIAAGEFHNLVIRQGVGFPAITDVSPVRSWPGEAVAKSILVENAVVSGPASYTAMGLQPDLVLNPVTGLISGTVAAGARKAVRVSAATNQGLLSQVVWFDTAGGVAPTAIALSSSQVMENSPPGTVVGTLSAVDPNAGDRHVFRLVADAGASDGYWFLVSGNRLMVRLPVGADFEAGETQLLVRVAAEDSGGNVFEQTLVLNVTDDSREDGDGDGVPQSVEEDVFGTSDSAFDDFNIADSDGDGVSSLIENAFNLDPKVAGPPLRLVPGAGSTAGTPGIDLVGDAQGSYRLRMEYLRRVGDGMTYVPQFGGGLNFQDWEQASDPVETPVNSEWVRCVVVDSVSVAGAPRRFARIAVRYVNTERMQDVDGDGIIQAMEEDVFGTSDSLANPFAVEDVDQDGLPGIIEYAFNLEPRIPGPPQYLVPGVWGVSGLPAISVVTNAAGQRRLRIEYLRRVGSILTYTPQFSSGLGAADWQAATNPIEVEGVDEAWERCYVEDTEIITGAARRFARVAVSW